MNPGAVSDVRRDSAQLELFLNYVTWQELNSQTAKVSEEREQRNVRDGAAVPGKNWLAIFRSGYRKRKEVNHES